MSSDRYSLGLACSSIAIIAALGAAPAWAQTTSTDAAVATATSQAKPAPTAKKKGARKNADDVGDNLVQEVVVTGTSISGVKPVGAEAIVITREAAERTGFTTAAELLRTVPQVRVGEHDREGGRSTISPQNSAGANSVSLRGLTSTSSTTLILVDGHRTVSTGTNSSTVDANQIPLAAMERVEIVADGASAVYGSDAIGGVINYILRKDYRGGEVSVRGNNTFGGKEAGVSATLGQNWKGLGSLGGGNVLMTVDYAHRDAYRASKSPYLRSDLSPLGGQDMRLRGGAAMIGFNPSIVVTPDGATNPPLNPTLPGALTSVYYGIPAGNGAGLTVGDLLLNQPGLTSFSDYDDYLGKQERVQATIYLRQNLGESLELLVQGRYNDRKTTTNSVASGAMASRTVALRSMLRDANGNVTTTPNPNYIANIPGVSQGSPGFPPFFPATPAADLSVLYPALKDFGPVHYVGSDESVNLTTTLRAKLPGKWDGEASYTIGRNQGCTYCLIDSYINPEGFQHQIDIGALNPLSSAPLDQAMLGKVAGSQKQVGHNGMDILALKFNGPLFKLPGGSVRAAVGAERNKVFNWNENTSVTGLNNAPTVLTDRGNSYYDRTVSSLYGEVYVPVVGDELIVPLVKRFVVSAALRYDKYDDAGKSTNPKLGFAWDVNDMLSFSGTWGTSFRSPSITDKNPAAYVSGLVIPFPVNAANLDPRVSNLFCYGPGLCYTNAALLFGSNPDLKPEQATNWSLSAKLSPGHGFKASVNYYNIDYRDRLVFPNLLTVFPSGPDAGSNPPTYGGYESYVIPINNPATCDNSDLNTADPTLQPFLRTPTYSAGGGLGQLGGLANFCSIKVLLDSRFTNMAITKTDGLDFDVSWEGDVGEVRLSVAANANLILNYNEQVKSDLAEQDRLGLLGTPVKWRGRGNVSANWRGMSATVFANYTGGFVNDQARDARNAVAPNQKVPAYTTFDLNLGYTTGPRTQSALKNLRYSLTVQNLFDDYPPLVFQQDRVIADVHGIPFGRTFAFQLTAGF
jgi:iron complex outermembrane receptor protein